MIRAILIAMLIAGPAFADTRESHASIPRATNSESDNLLLIKKHLELLIRDMKGGQQRRTPGMEHARNSILSQLSKNRDLWRLALDYAQKQGVDVSTLTKDAAYAPVKLKALDTQSGRAIPSAERYESLRKWDLGKLAQRFEPALQDALRKANNGTPTEPGPITMENIESVLNRFEGLIDKIQAQFPDSVRNISELNVPRPDVPHGISLPRSFFAPSSLSRIAQAVIIALAVAAAGWFLVHLSFEPRRRRQASGQHFTLIAPDQVATREDLIQAFERLALVFFGSEAAHWHHRLVAQRLGEKASAPADADLLATLYEQARYAPDATDIDWRASREPLRRIAQRRR